MNFRTRITAVTLGGALLVGCTAGDEGSQGVDDTSAPTTTAVAGEAPTGPSPGVTDDSIKVGISYVDLAALGDIVDIDHGDYEGSYQALIDDINASGGIHGRTIDPVFAPVNPSATASAEAACVELTEDEDVFVVVGFFLGEAVLCPVETHETAVIGGSMSDDALARARAPWFTAEVGADNQQEVVTAFAEAGEFDGTLGVFAGQAEADLLNDDILPLLDELGIEVTESAVLDAPTDDITANNAATAVIAERFESSGVDQVLLLGTAGLGWATGTESLDYRPQLLVGNANAILAYAADDSRDLSLLDGAISGGSSVDNQGIYELETTQECVGVIEAAGVEVPEPDSLGDDDAETFTAPFAACRDIALLRALLDATGPELNYGSLEAGADGLVVDLPTYPEPLTYGPPPAADGDPPVSITEWDPDERTFVPREAEN